MRRRSIPWRILAVVVTVAAFALAPPVSGLTAPLSSGEPDDGGGYAVVLRGSPEEMGSQYGQQAKEAIKANLSLFKEIAERSGLSQEEVLAAGRSYEQVLAREAPQLVIELKAMAEASGVPYEELLAFNALEEQVLGGGCTTLLATGKATGDGKAYFQKNRDATRSWQAVLQVTPAAGYRYIAITTAGSTGVAMGVNEKGVSTGNNVLSTWDTGPGLGNLTVNRMVLEQAASAREAVGLIQGWPRASGSNYPVADPREAAFVETTHSATAVMWVVDAAMAHTNHYILPGMEGYDIHSRPQDQRWSWYISTERRLARANQLLQADFGKLDIHRMVAISEDQEGEDSVYWIDAQAVINQIPMGSVAAGTHDGSKLRMWAQLG